MAFEFTTTKEAAESHGVKILVYGRGGVGKTTLVASLPKVLLLSAESGILSLRHLEIPTVVIDSFEKLEEVYAWIYHYAVEQGFESIAIDSLSDIAETCLKNMKFLHKDGRKAYGEMGDTMMDWMKKFRDLQGLNVYFSAKQGNFTDEMQHLTKYGPMLPGSKLTQQAPYLFDEVFCLEVHQDAEGNSFRALRTQPDMQYDAKDRSGALDPFEAPDLGNIIRKIHNHQQAA